MITQLGRIERCALIKGGYRDTMLGIGFTLSGPGWGVQDFWALAAAPLGERLESLMDACGVKELGDLVGKPVEISLDADGRLTSWRILTEVLPQ